MPGGQLVIRFGSPSQILGIVEAFDMSEHLDRWVGSHFCSRQRSQNGNSTRRRLKFLHFLSTQSEHMQDAIVNDYYFCRKLEIKVTCGPSTSYVRSSHSLHFKFNKWNEPQFLPIKDDFSPLIQFHYLNYRAEERIPWAIVVDWKEDDLKLEVKGWFDLM